jgi:protein tyrosine/serine phosphatase
VAGIPDVETPPPEREPPPARAPDGLGRRLELEGAWNFRDLGGYPGHEGRQVRWRRLFRADGLDRLTTADLVHIEQLRLRTVIDLRTGDEVARGRLASSAGAVDWYHLPMLDVLPPPEHYGTWIDPSVKAEQYLGMVSSAPATVAGFLRLACDPASYPLVFHCFAGKDRTGILTALVLGLLGVADDDIAADYALSGPAMPRLLEWLRANSEESAERLREEPNVAVIMAAEPATMSEFLRRFRHVHGSFEAYAAAVGYPDAASRLAEILLEPPATG